MARKDWMKWGGEMGRLTRKRSWKQLLRRAVHVLKAQGLEEERSLCWGGKLLLYPLLFSTGTSEAN